MLEEAKSVCDYLLVGLQTNPKLDRSSKNAPVQSLLERQIQLWAVKFVDSVVVYETEKELEQIFYSIPMDIRILGAEYAGISFTGKEICENLGIELYYNQRKHEYSSTQLRDRISLSDK